MDKKQIIDALVSHPLLASLLVMCTGLLTFMHSLPWFLSFSLVAVLVAVAMFYGQKLQLLDQNS
jgi:hypothetical protein